MKHYSVMKKNESLSPSVIQMELEDIMQVK
jgi:hypothetical protein